MSTSASSFACATEDMCGDASAEALAKAEAASMATETHTTRASAFALWASADKPHDTSSVVQSTKEDARLETRGPSDARSRCRLYLITPPKLEPIAFGETLKAALDGGDVATLQLRLKEVSDDEIRRATETLMPIAQRAGAAFLINDRADLAAEMDADGVHVGQEDTPYAEARALVGADRIVGVTCHNSQHLAMEAAEAGADYVAFGAFFPTSTKIAETTADIEILTWWSELMVVPCVAIGGITVDNARPLIEAGADFIAVSSGVWSYPLGPQAAVKAFNALF